MKKWLENLKFFWNDRVYVASLALTAACGYGFLITHGTVGIDDTPYAYYFEEGLAAIVGRWVLFLLNKLLHFADFAPFFADLAGVLLLMAAATVWCVLFRCALGEAAPRRGYLFFALVFLSCPLISEVYTYHLHNGISLGYLCCGISLCFFRAGLEGLEARGTGGGRPWRRGLPFLAAAGGLWIAVGCYESLMVVWLVGILLTLLAERYGGKRRNAAGSLLCGGGVAVTAVVLRSLTVAGLTRLFGLEYLREEAVQRSVAEMALWMFQEGAFAEFAMALKRMAVMYGAFAYAYYPILIFVLAVAVIWLFGLWRGFRQRDWGILFLTACILPAAFLLVLVEGKATLYRSAQFLPVVCGFGALVFFYAAGNLADRLKGRIGTAVRAAAAVVLAAVVWNQCVDLNRWFYVDDLKYQDAVNTVGRIAHELEKDFDVSKPVVFTGTYDIPESLIADAYVPYGSETFFKINFLTSFLDEHLLEKFYRPYGVWVAQTPSLSVLDWGRYAFGDDTELARFFHMHGFELTPLLGVDYEEAERLSRDWPEFPREGSLADMGDYIIVHF